MSASGTEGLRRGEERPGARGRSRITACVCVPPSIMTLGKLFTLVLEGSLGSTVKWDN
jgi:hypothetical protein